MKSDVNNCRENGPTGRVQRRLPWGGVLGACLLTGGLGVSAGVAHADLVPPQPAEQHLNPIKAPELDAMGKQAPAGAPAGAPTGAPTDAAGAQAGAPAQEAAPGQGPGAAIGSSPADSMGGQVVPVVPPMPVAPRPPTDVTVTVPENDDGLNLLITWKPSPETPATESLPVSPVLGYAVFRSESPTGPFEPVSAELGPKVTSYSDTVSSDVVNKPPKDRYYYRVAARYGTISPQDLVTGPSSSEAVEGTPRGSWFHTSKTTLLLLLGLFTFYMFYYTRAMRLGRQLFIRRIPGIDAIEEAIGRSTEMGKPILYVPGIDELQDIQTIASMLILGRVAEIVANYESDMIVPCTYPMVREVADEVVRAGYYMAGRPDAYEPKNVRFISSEQFAFCAGTNGIILRQKPAANLFLGRFFAESLIFAETGFINKSIQIAGTAEPTQLPFFVVSCDYTVLGEELFAVSAYLSKDPRLVSSLRASDMIKAIAIMSVIIGTALNSVGIGWVVRFWMPGGN